MLDTCFEDIKGEGEKDAYIDYVSDKDECVSLVKKRKPNATGAIHYRSDNAAGGACYAVFKMTELRTSGTWKTCYFDSMAIY